MKVKEWMTTKVVTVSLDTSVKKAFGLMKHHGFHHLPVVQGEKVVGIVTDRDLRRPNISDVFKGWDELYRLGEDISVEDVMTAPAITVSLDSDLPAAASMLVEKKINALPVVSHEGKLAGIITTVDFLKAFVRKKSDQ